MSDLHRDLRSRYEKALEVMVRLANKGILHYQPRAEDAPARNMNEALRQRLKKYAKVTEYEHNIIIEGALGNTMYESLAERDIGGYADKGTIYLQGFGRYREKRVSQKFYSISSRAGLSDVQLFKLETTFHKQYFKSKGIKINDLLEQPDIQELLRPDLEKYVRKALRSLGRADLKAFQLELGLEKAGRKFVSGALLNRWNTLTERVAILRRYHSQLQRGQGPPAEKDRIAAEVTELQTLLTMQNDSPPAP